MQFDNSFGTQRILPVNRVFTMSQSVTTESDRMISQNDDVQPLLEFSDFTDEFLTNNRSIDNNSAYRRINIDNVSRYECVLCSNTFKSRDSVLCHRRRMHSEQIFQCPKCPKKLTTEVTLRSHVKTSHTRQFPCSDCNRIFGTVSKLNRHRTVVHTNERQRSVCDICGKTFKNVFSLKFHRENIHYFSATFCDVCGIRCNTRSVYNEHRRKCGSGANRDVEPPQMYTCDICKKSYTTKTSLQFHMYKHLNMKPFKCHICHIRFSSANYLQAHKAVHSGKSFLCPVCNKAFNRNDNLNQHVKALH